MIRVDGGHNLVGCGDAPTGPGVTIAAIDGGEEAEGQQGNSTNVHSENRFSGPGVCKV